MTDFTVSITDPAELEAITWAREHYNERLPKGEDGQPVDPLPDDNAYMQFVMGAAVKSYAQQKAIADAVGGMPLAATLAAAGSR